MAVSYTHLDVYKRQGMEYRVSFYARMAHYQGNLEVSVRKDGKTVASAKVECIHAPEGAWQKWNRYETVPVSYTHLPRKYFLNYNK